MIKKFIYFTAFVCLVTASGLGAAENPEAVSPGGDLRASVVNQVCPTFSWAQVPGAAAYQIAVFEMGQRFEGLSYYEDQVALSQPVLIRKITGSASSWTPSLEQALQNGGHYVWFVQAQDVSGGGPWSVGKKFVVRSPLGLTEIKEKVKQELEAKGVKGDLVDKAFEGLESRRTKQESGGGLKSKVQSLEEKGIQAKPETKGNMEIKSKEYQITGGTGDFTAGSLGSEGDGNYNVYYGTGSGTSLDTTFSGAYNDAFFGYYAGTSTNMGSDNTFMGGLAGYFNTSGDHNTFLGSGAGYSATTGESNNFIGSHAGYSNTTGSENIFLGSNTGYFNTTGYRNSFIGHSAGHSNTTGYCNVFLGRHSGVYNTTGNENTFIGYKSGRSNTTGDYNTSLGYYAGYSNITGTGNVFLGYNAGYNETGSNTLYIENSSSSSPLIYGEFDNDLVTINGVLNVTESNINVDTTSKRARFKLQADGGRTNMDDYFNFTMRNDYGDVTLSVWDHSASGWLPMLSYEYLNSKVDFKDNDIVTTGTISSGGGAYTSGGAWIEASSRDYKENIMEMGQEESIRALESLNPVRYNYKNKKDEEFLGFIAEDVPDLVAMNGRKGMRAMDIVAVLTKVVQNQQKIIKEYENAICENKGLISKQNEKNIEQEKVLKQQNELINQLIKKIEELDNK